MTDASLPPNRRFASLDEYLSYLRKVEAPVDGPWYREIKPGVYQLQTGNLRIFTPEGEAKGEPNTFTREELMKKFGFSK